MIDIDQYVGPWKDSPDWDAIRQANAASLLAKCSDLETEMIADGIEFPVNPKTGTQVSGEVYGGFRPQSCPIGASHSNHKEGRAVDRWDPDNRIDMWCMAHQNRLREHGIYIEHPDSTPHWSHWQGVPPGSGNTVFRP
jgi:hypothetical protein